MNANVHQNAEANNLSQMKLQIYKCNKEIMNWKTESFGSRFEGEIICVSFETEFFSEEFIWPNRAIDLSNV